MMRKRDPLILFLGILFIVLGILMVLGENILGVFIDFLGIILIVVGILILIKTLPGGTLFGVAALIIGILLLGNFLDFQWTRELMRILNFVVGIALIVLGVLKLR